MLFSGAATLTVICKFFKKRFRSEMPLKQQEVQKMTLWLICVPEPLQSYF